MCGDGVGQVGTSTSELLGGDVGVTCFPAGMVARKRSFQGGEGTRAEKGVGELERNCTGAITHPHLTKLFHTITVLAIC